MLSITFLFMTSDEHNAKVGTFDCIGKRRKVSDYYKKQERLLEGFTEIETMAENGGMPGSLTEVGCVQLDDFE